MQDMVCCPCPEGHTMIDLDFCGYLSLPGSSLGESLDAAGCDACIAAYDRDCGSSDEPGEAGVAGAHE